MSKAIRVLKTVSVMVLFCEVLWGSQLSIYEIQYTTDSNGASEQAGNIIDCRGGIVVHKWAGSRTRLTLYDPAYPDGWGGIMVKDRYGVGVFADVNVGDWVELSNVEVEEFRATTFLQYKPEYDANYRILSRDNPVPRPLAVRVDEIAAPVEGLDEWVVADHNAEKYEGMLIKVIDVNVRDTGYGKAYDNYILESNADPNLGCWVSDYMNEDTVEIYHPYVLSVGLFCGVTGILEQYAGESEGINYDYYQLLTRAAADFTIEQYCDLNYDCGVDFVDYALFAGRWLAGQECGEPDWCGGADVTQNGAVDVFDLSDFVQQWLEGKL